VYGICSHTIAPSVGNKEFNKQRKKLIKPKLNLATLVTLLYITSLKIFIHIFSAVFEIDTPII